MDAWSICKSTDGTKHWTYNGIEHDEWVNFLKNGDGFKNSLIPKSHDDDVQNIQTTHC